jgi:hypothetical protein
MASLQIAAYQCLANQKRRHACQLALDSRVIQAIFSTGESGTMVRVVGVPVGDGGVAVDGEVSVAGGVVSVAGVAVPARARPELDSWLGSWHIARSTTP